MNLPVDDAVKLAAVKASRHPGVTIVVMCDDYEVIGLDDACPVVFPVTAATHLVVESLDDVAKFMQAENRKRRRNRPSGG